MEYFCRKIQNDYLKHTYTCNKHFSFLSRCLEIKLPRQHISSRQSKIIFLPMLYEQTNVCNFKVKYKIIVILNSNSDT